MYVCSYQRTKTTAIADKNQQLFKAPPGEGRCLPARAHCAMRGIDEVAFVLTVCDAMRCNAMQCNAMRGAEVALLHKSARDAMRCDAMRCDTRDRGSISTLPVCAARMCHARY
eukprot:308107-Rhodomonas_salina.1